MGFLSCLEVGKPQLSGGSALHLQPLDYVLAHPSMSSITFVHRLNFPSLDCFLELHLSLTGLYIEPKMTITSANWNRLHKKHTEIPHLKYETPKFWNYVFRVKRNSGFIRSHRGHKFSQSTWPRGRFSQVHLVRVGN